MFPNVYVFCFFFDCLNEIFWVRRYKDLRFSNRNNSDYGTRQQADFKGFTVSLIFFSRREKIWFADYIFYHRYETRRSTLTTKIYILYDSRCFSTNSPRSGKLTTIPPFLLWKRCKYDFQTVFYCVSRTHTSQYNLGSITVYYIYVSICILINTNTMRAAKHYFSTVSILVFYYYYYVFVA